jgi:hypothetical protein
MTHIFDDMNSRVAPIYFLLLLFLLNSKPLFAHGSGDALDFSNFEYVDCGSALRILDFPFTIESWVYLRSGATIAYPIIYTDIVLSDPTYYGVQSVIGVTGQAVWYWFKCFE